MRTNTERLNTIIGNLIARAQLELTSSNRAERYSGVAILLPQIESNFQALQLTTEELEIANSIDERQNLEDEIDTGLERIVSAYKFVGQVAPEFLHKRVETRLDYYERVFGSFDSIPESVFPYLEMSGIAKEVLPERFATWKTLYSAEKARGGRMEKLQEAIDMKKALVGLLALLNVPHSDIYSILWKKD